MLNHLSVKNYALIDSVEIDFHQGLSIITGETGAGKSILMGALSLILGQRADAGILKNKESKCIIEGEFLLKDQELEEFFSMNEIDYSKTTLLRREINQDGKSRAFINDTPVTLNVLHELGVQLVDIHSQHQNLDLDKSGFQLNIIDTYSGNSAILDRYKSVYNDYQEIKKELEALKQLAGKSMEDFEYLKFRYDELEKARLSIDEKEQLDEEYKALQHTEEIRKGLTLTLERISENPESVIQNLNECVKTLNQVSVYLPKLAEFKDRINSCYIELKDITSEMEVIAGKIHFDPERATFVDERLDLLNHLLQKHKVNQVGDLIKIREELSQKIGGIESYDEKLKELNQAFEKKESELTDISQNLSRIRINSFSEIEQYVMEQLKSLGMPNAVFSIKHENLPLFAHNGRDKINFLFSANKNGTPQNIARVASGGEISRLMLSIKSLISKTASLPTIIFDEIDAGVSGETADKMGKIMLKMAEYMQVVNITHLPQVAAKGNTHYLVYKQDMADKTSTFIKKLNQEERLMEIAKMLSGENISQQALENAKVLLNP